MVSGSVRVIDVTIPGKSGREMTGNAVKCGYRGASSPKPTREGDTTCTVLESSELVLFSLLLLLLLLLFNASLLLLSSSPFQKKVRWIVLVDDAFVWLLERDAAIGSTKDLG